MGAATNPQHVMCPGFSQSVHKVIMGCFNVPLYGFCKFPHTACFAETKWPQLDELDRWMSRLGMGTADNGHLFPFFCQVAGKMVQKQLGATGLGMTHVDQCYFHFLSAF